MEVAHYGWKLRKQKNKYGKEENNLLFKFEYLVPAKFQAFFFIFYLTQIYNQNYYLRITTLMFFKGLKKKIGYITSCLFLI